MLDPIIITLRGEYTVERQLELRRELEPFYTHPYLVLDMTSINYVESVCLAEFMRMRKARATAHLPPACFVVNNDRFGRLFRFLGLDEVFTVVESLDEAFAPELELA
jgi:anti-anti-sigma regulatory factor